MSNVFNLLGGGGGMKPVIRIHTSTGATVTCDGVVGTEVSGVWNFTTTIGTHTIVASMNGNTKTQTVLVDAVEMFNIDLHELNRTYLYILGDECTALTGGWSNSGWTDINAATKNADNFYIEAYNENRGLGTTNQIDFTNYTKLCVDWLGINGEQWHPTIQLSRTKGFATGEFIWYPWVSQTLYPRQVQEFDISSITGNGYVCFLANDDTGSRRYGTMWRLWLE